MNGNGTGRRMLGSDPPNSAVPETLAARVEYAIELVGSLEDKLVQYQQRSDARAEASQRRHEELRRDLQAVTNGLGKCAKASDVATISSKLDRTIGALEKLGTSVRDAMTRSKDADARASSAELIAHVAAADVEQVKASAKFVQFVKAAAPALGGGGLVAIVSAIAQSCQ